jgi:hypothetical protein
MNTIQILEILSNDPFSKKYFKNVLAIDELPNSSKKIKNSAFIINTDKKTEKGEHWLSVFYDGQSNCQFFDSLGLGPEIYNLENFIINTSKAAFTNKYAVQSIFSEYCGYYAILFVMIRSRNVSFRKFLEYFDQDTLKNDFKIENLIKTFI